MYNNNLFYDTYKNYSKEELFGIIINQKDYQPEAIKAAMHLIENKKWSDELAIFVEEMNKNREEKEEILNQEIVEKAAYYKRWVELREENNHIEINIGDVPKFEGELNILGIEYFKEEKNIGTLDNKYVIQRYFFKSEDIEAVNELTKKLQLITGIHSNNEKLFKYERIVYLVMALFMLYMLTFSRCD